MIEQSHVILSYHSGRMTDLIEDKVSHIGSVKSLSTDRIQMTLLRKPKLRYDKTKKTRT